MSELRKILNGLPSKAQRVFIDAYNKSASRNDYSTSIKIAWEVLKTKFKLVDGDWVSKDYNRVLNFVLESDESFVSKGSDGNYYWQGVLSDTMVDGQGKSWTPEALKNIADEINNKGIAGFISHDDWNDFCFENVDLSEEDFIAKARSNRVGILRGVKAVFKQGKLFLKALIDKRYLTRVQQFTQMSIEALVPKRFRVGNKYTGGIPLGFALTNNPVNPRAKGEIVKD